MASITSAAFRVCPTAICPASLVRARRPQLRSGAANMGPGLLPKAPRRRELWRSQRNRYTDLQAASDHALSARRSWLG